MSTVFSLADEFVDGIAALQPILASQMGLEGHDDRWGDLSPNGWHATQLFLDGVSLRLEKLPPSEDRWEQLGRRVLREHVSLEQERIARAEPFRDLNNIASPPQVLRETFDLMPRGTTNQWTNIASRLESIGEAFNGYIACLDEGRSSGCSVARRQVEACAQQCETHASDGSYFNTLLEHAKNAEIDNWLKNRIHAGVDVAKTAYRQLGHYLETKYLPGARVADAVGFEEYRFASRRFLGTDIDLVATYHWGWEEVVQILEEMQKVGKKIHATDSIAEIANLLKNREYCVVRSRAEFLETMRHRQQDALERLDGAVFDVPPEIHALDVRFAPSGGALGAYYIPPSEDFSRQGTVWYVKPEQPLYPLFDEITTAYHEGFPGHHLQVGVQMCLGKHLTRAHRLAIWNEGYGEGWALYAERLMGELGFLENPAYAFGLLSSQMMRACRIVVDIGMHLDLSIPGDVPFHPGEIWTFETAVALLKEYGLLDDAYARSEVTRYLGFPGQAISYKVGEQKILELRFEAEKKDGFTLKSFHSRVLGSGPVGLDHLCEILLDT